jgi:DNA-binding transcriptional ArsR family regulator
LAADSPVGQLAREVIALPPSVSERTDSLSVDDVFRALADPTRRRVLERLSSAPASVSQLAEPFEMALPSFVQHLKTLESCGLVRSHKSGRVRTYVLAPDTLKVAEDWLAGQRRFWERRMDQFDAYVMQLKETQRADRTSSAD